MLQKGVHMNIDAYSIFMDNAKMHKTALDGILKSAGITTVVVVGIAYDFCVAWTATDAVDLGYNAVIISDAAAPIGVPNSDGTTSIDTAEADFAAKGVEVVTMADLADERRLRRRRNRSRKLEQEKGRVYKLW